MATATLALQVVGFTKIAKHFGIGPDVGELLFAQIAGDRRQIAAREYFAFVRDETHTGPGEAALRHGVHVVGMPAGMSGVRVGGRALWPQ